MSNLKFSDVREAVSIKRYLDDRDIEIQNNNRFNAVWRGGDSFSCSFDDAKRMWCDHKERKGGSVLDLCMKVEGLGSIAEATSTLGDRYHLKTDADEKEVAHYDYTDEYGKPLYCKVRYEPKTFKYFQLKADGTRGAKGMGDHPHVLYRLPEIIKAVKDGARIFIAEGEKDVDNLHALGLTATSSKEWDNEKNGARFAECLRGASRVLIIADHDDAQKQKEKGQHIAVAVRDALSKVGVSSSIAYVESGKDATDWIETMRKDKLSDDAIRQKFIDLADDPPEWTWTAAAEPFSNYTETTEKEHGKMVTRFHARTIKDVRSDLLKRTGNWPRQIGSTLFVFQPDAAYGTQRYLQITKPPALFAWLRETQTPRWKNANGGAQDSRGVNFVTMEQLYLSLNANAQHYEGISRAPHWPLRPDQFYDYGKLPPASEGHKVFWQMMDFFCLANDTYRLLAAAFFIAPMFYKTGTGKDNGLPTPMPRPLWLIDTVDAQGSGKSTLAKKVALLYGSAILDVTMGQLVKNPEEVLKRILSVEGRQKRVFLIDNVSGTIKDGTLASWITSSTLSGRAAYGHGDETRANDFTWCITVNGAEIDTDTATRSYTVKVRKRDTKFTTDLLDDYGQPLKWESAVDRFITHNRLQIFADILDMLDRAKPRSSESRFPDFDACVLSAVCATDDEFDACRASIEADANGANVDAKLADDFTEAVEVWLAQNVSGAIPEYDANALTMLTHKTVQQIVSSASGKIHDQTIPQVRTLLKSGIAAKFSRKNPRLCAHNGEPHPEAITYGVHRLQDGATNAKYQLIDLASFQSGTLQPRIIRRGEIKVSTLF